MSEQLCGAQLLTGVNPQLSVTAKPEGAHTSLEMSVLVCATRKLPNKQGQELQASQLKMLCSTCGHFPPDVTV